ncbi:MAG: LysR family transcriptional regulator, partial [Actinobacteria bacterium]|nr:LysR family transcriptional regulator [Actinomycetota bacterium]
MDLRINLQKLHLFASVVRLGGVGRAADANFLAQPAVTAHIRSLEERLGTELFYRDGRGLSLTPAGRIAYAWAEDILRRTRFCERELDDLAAGFSGRIVVAAGISPGSYLVPAVLAGFRERHPTADVRLAVVPSDRAIEDVRTGRVDFAIVATEPGLKLPGMAVREIGRDEIVLVAAPDSAPHTGTVSIAELGLLPFIDMPEGFPDRCFIEDRLREAGVYERDIVLELGHPEAAKRAMRDGLGYTLLLRSAVARELESGELEQVNVERLHLEVPICLVHYQEIGLSALQERLVERIATALEGLPAGDGPVSFK